MQIVDLLRHTSGLTYGFQNRTNVDAAYRETEDRRGRSGRHAAGMIDALAAMPLEFSPGRGLELLGLDRRARLPGRQDLRPAVRASSCSERIFDPLGMIDTDFHVPADKAHRFAACYSADPQGGMTFHAADRKGG